MKKGMLVFSVALLLAAFMPQPVAAGINIDLGIKGGISLAKYKSSDTGETPFNLEQPVFGVFATFNLTKSIAIQPEIYLLTQGGIMDPYDDGIDFWEYKNFYRYIHVPVLAKVRLIKKGKFMPILFAGPAVDVLLSAHNKTYKNGELNNDFDIKPFLKSTNLSLVFGGGLEFMMNKLMLVLDIRYDMGLADISEFAGDDTLKTRALMFMVGVGF
jgi:hypothetical protein